MLKGRITFKNFKLSSPRALEIDHLLAEPHKISRENYEALITELGMLCEVSSIAVDNLILLAARTEIAKRLAGEADYTGTINYGAVGTASTAVADSDTALDAEAARVQIATLTRTDDQISIDFYFSKSTTSGTFEEFGTFIDGTGSADSGLLFNRALTGGWAKTSLEAMTVSVQININHA
jgi:hypothetical protein